MKKFAAILLAVMMLFALTACGGSSEPADPNCGTYTLTSAEMMGISMAPEEVFTGESYLELRDGGDASLTLDGDTVPATWVLDGANITVSIEDGGVTYDSTGTLTEGVIVINLLDMGMNFTFEKAQ